MKIKMNLKVEGIPLSEVEGLIDCISAVGGTVTELPELVVREDAQKEPFRLKAQPVKAEKKPRRFVNKKPKRFTRGSTLQYVKRVPTTDGTQVDTVQKVCADLRTFTPYDVSAAIPEKWSDNMNNMTTTISRLLDLGGVKVVDK